MASSVGDWVDLGSEHVGFTATLDKADGISVFAKDPEKAIKSGNPDDEYLMTLSAEVNLDALPWMKKVKDEQVEFILILDLSGSMAGTPWRQVQSGAIKVLEKLKNNQKVSVKIIVYNDKAKFVEMSSSVDVTCHQIRQLRAGGSTNFVDVFSKLGNLMSERIEAAAKPPGKTRTVMDEMRAGQKKKMFVIFMTDGCDTCNTPPEIMKAKEKLQDIIGNYGEEVVVHVLGFGDQYDDAFLRDLSYMGSSDGSYNYVNTKDEDGNLGLERSLTDLLEATTGMVGKSVFLSLKMTNNASFLGTWFGEEVKEIVLQAFMTVDNTKAKLVTYKFVKVPKGDTLKMNIEMVRDLTSKSNTLTLCTLKEVKMVNQSSKKVQLRKLRTGLNMLTAKLADSVDDKNKDKIIAEGQRWQQMMKKAMEEHGRPDSKDDKEIQELCDVIKNGLVLCDRVLTKDPNETEEGHIKRSRGLETAYNLKSKQMHNTRFTKKTMPSRSDRSQMQYNQGLLD